MKKFINFLGVIAICIATTFTFMNSNKVNAMQIINNQNEVYSTTQTIDRNNFNSFLFENYDYNIIESIEISSSLSFTNVNTNITTNSITSFSKCTWGSYSANSGMYYMKLNLSLSYDYDIDDGDTYFLEFSKTTTPIQALDTNNCTTSSRNLYLSTSSYYNYVFIGTQTNLTNAYNSIRNNYLTTSYSSDSVMTNNIFNKIKNNYNVDTVYTAKTGLSSTNITGTASTSTSSICSKNLSNYSYNVYMFGEEVYYNSYTSNISLRNNVCTADLITLSFSATYSFTNLSEERKRELWNILTQFQKENVNNIANDALLRIRFFSDDISTTITNQNIPLYININFNRAYFYEFNTIYENVMTLSEVNSNWYYDNNNKYHADYDSNGWCSYETSVEDCSGSRGMYLSKNITTSFNYIGKLFYIKNFNFSTGFALSWSFNYLLLSNVIIDQSEGSISYKDCSAWQIMCHLENGFKKIVYNMPILSDIYIFIDNTIDMVSDTFDFFEDYKEIAVIGSAVMIAIGLHFIKRMVV